ncbi:acyl-CoA carboxylase subunit epsilon [Tessaracoccus sp. OH4464_COT-324]|uniref:acyl-CoA carboxylase subunit epsilon n=1 Tax=Tessaracoccus sp. OH4464_COT-324 TaxID=2491059 RepID=UPI000F63D7D3|nr:acyl-CoA carboxylase subunit epsilon [Tessaracoccus sp. OH4464_COT-324]RRD44750.1 acyl-CoA carboxylase subunit epsilon [Tessaracoccus sp. OH4464_COT-324]
MNKPSRFIKGTPLTEEELGAIAAVLNAKRRANRLRPTDDRPLAGGWNSYYRIMRPPLVPGREAWRRR